MGVKTFLWLDLENKQRPGKFCSRKYKANFTACDLSVKGVVTFGVILYSNQCFALC